MDSEKTVRVQIDLPEILVEWIDAHVEQDELASRDEAIAHAIAEYCVLLDMNETAARQRAAKTARERDEIMQASWERRARYYPYQRHV